MAKQLNTTIRGRIDDYSFYYDSLHGYLVRKTGGVTSKQYRADQRYAAARNASSEFAAVSKVGKLIRNALSPFINQIKDGTMVNRLNKELLALKQLDNKNPRGKRNPQTMMTNTNANKWLRIFQFNRNANLYDICRDFRPNDCRVKLQPAAFPKDATHAGLTLIRTVIDFEKKEFNSSSSLLKMVAKESPEEIFLSIDQFSKKNGIEITCLKIVFFSENDGKLSPLKEKVHAMGIVGVKESVIKPSLRKCSSKINSRLLKDSIAYQNNSKKACPKGIAWLPPFSCTDFDPSKTSP